MSYASRRLAEVIGHRGSPREFRENTLPSLQRAFAWGAEGLGTDVPAAMRHEIGARATQ
jgi:glycerophosphoryl diester phosphodiesterase